ncbi:MAG: class I SAM-dependent RNA methyltransferase [Acidobacteria bacterium]|nr:class I SAM-dependent RNA methyltransferase [Acidobacteriota bacterium]
MNSEANVVSEAVVRVERPATGGGVGRLEDGRVVFVRHSLPGELVRVAITENTANFSRGDAIEVLEPSTDRVTPPCEYARPGACGGCDLQHATASAQTAWKLSLVREHLRRIAGVEMELEISPVPGVAKGSRTRLRCAVNEDGQLCLRGARSHDLVAIQSCWIADPVFAPAFQASWDGAEEVELRAIGDGEPFAVVRRDTHRGSMIELCSLRGEPLEPSTQSRVSVGGHYFSVSPRSFWQSHSAAPQVLLDTVLAFARVGEGDHVVDLFSGVGLFAVPLAKAVGPRGRVTAVESSPYAVRDARQNGDGLRQLKVREWTVSPRAINDAVGKGDIVVLDPPRSGLARGVAEALLRRAPQRLVYVSCDPATFARDLKTLQSGGFSLSKLSVFDLFPMTEHVELVGLLDIRA